MFVPIASFIWSEFHQSFHSIAVWSLRRFPGFWKILLVVAPRQRQSHVIGHHPQMSHPPLTFSVINTFKGITFGELEGLSMWKVSDEVRVP